MPMKAQNALLIGIPVMVGGALILSKVLAKPSARLASFAGWATNIVQSPTHQTTTRQRDGATGYDFQNYPLIKIVPDIVGTYNVNWDWENYFDGSGPFGRAYGLVNTFDLTTPGVESAALKLIDQSGFNTRNGSEAFGDPDGYFDGIFHHWQSYITARITSPSGQGPITVQGIMDEYYKSVAPTPQFSASWAGWDTTIIP